MGFCDLKSVGFFDEAEKYFDRSTFLKRFDHGPNLIKLLGAYLGAYLGA